MVKLKKNMLKFKKCGEIKKKLIQIHFQENLLNFEFQKRSLYGRSFGGGGGNST